MLSRHIQLWLAIPYLSTTPMGPLITRQRLARALDCTPRHITRLVRQGVLPPPIRLGGRVYWQTYTIKRWFDTRTNAATNGGQPANGGGSEND